MSVLKPRNRLVYFRVTEEEFQQLNHLCISRGARSISDLARSAVRNLMQDGATSSADQVSGRLIVLETMVQELNRKFNPTPTASRKAIQADTPEDKNGMTAEVQERNEDL